MYFYFFNRNYTNSKKIILFLFSVTVNRHLRFVLPKKKRIFMRIEKEYSSVKSFTAEHNHDEKNLTVIYLYRIQTRNLVASNSQSLKIQLSDPPIESPDTESAPPSQ